MTITKERLIESIAAQNGLNKVQSRQAIEALFEVIKDNLEKGEDVLISGFGKFCVRDKDKRRGRNPQTGEDLMLESRKVVTFRCSNVLRGKVNGGK